MKEGRVSLCENIKIAQIQTFLANMQMLEECF